MSNNWIGNAANLRDIYSLQVSGDWTPGDKIVLVIAAKELTITLGESSSSSLAEVAKAIRIAWNSATRLNGNSSTYDTDAMTDIAANAHGEFAEATATDDGVDTVYIAGNDETYPDKPIEFDYYLLVGTDGTEGLGELAVVHEQQATGQHWWSNPANWDGEVPESFSTAVFANSNVSCRYGFPSYANNTDVGVTVNQHASFTATLGSPPVNVDNPNKPYSEYRQLAPEFSNGGYRKHVLGLGGGDGSRLINIVDVQEGMDADTTDVDIYSTSTSPLIPNGYAANLQICNQDGDPRGTVNVLNGSVFLGMFASGPQSLFNKLRVAAGGQADVLVQDVGSVVDFVVEQGGGNVKIRQTVENDVNYALNCYGGELRAEDIQTTGNIDLIADDGTIVWNCADDFISLVVSGNGTFDAETDMRPFTGSNIQLYQGAKFLDRFGRGTYSQGPDLVRCDLTDVTVRIGQNKRLTVGNIP